VDAVVREARALVDGGARAVRAQVMVLGTFHFAGSTADERSSGPAGMLAPERQRQISEVVAGLLAFEPTRVAVEVRAADRARLDQDYAAYLGGALELGENEAYQLGFRLAAGMEHERIFSVDVDGRWLEPYVDLAEWAAAHDQAEWIEDPAAGGYVAAIERINRHEAERPLAEHLALLNRPEILALFNAEYLQQKLAIGDDETYPGADGFASSWANRHLRLYANMLRLRRDADERILLVIGAAHAAALRHLLDDAVHFEPVPPLPYLLPDAACAPVPCAAELTERLRAHVHPIEHDGARLSGPGLDLLVEAARDAQFVLIGEPHNTREVPLLVQGIFDALAARCGYDALAIEQGPLLVDALSAAARAGGLAAVREAARAHPDALHFQGDGELALVAAVASRTDGHDTVWGLDRELAVGHALDRFEASADGPALAGAIAAFLSAAPSGPAAGDGARSGLDGGPGRVADFARQVRALAADPAVRDDAL
jgi:hypothetical protein